MSNPEIQLNPQPEPPGSELATTIALRPLRLRPIAIGLLVLGVIVLVAGIAKFLPGGIGTGAAFVGWAIILFAFSFIPLPQAAATDEPPMSAMQKLSGIFFEPSRVFRNLRAHPRWLAAFVVLVLLNIIYTNAFVQRLTPERIVNFTVDKLSESSFKPPPDQLEKMREENLQQAKQPIQRIQTGVKAFFWLFVFGSIVAAFYLVIVMIFGGRINFWQALAVYFYASLPVAVITKVISLVILYLKDPEDVHPILAQESLVQDNLGVLFNPAEHPVLFVAASVIGVLSFYGLWLRARGLQNGGSKVSSAAAWGATLTVWSLALLFGLALAALFPSFIS